MYIDIATVLLASIYFIIVSLPLWATWYCYH